MTKTSPATSPTPWSTVANQIAFALLTVFVVLLVVLFIPPIREFVDLVWTMLVSIVQPIITLLGKAAHWLWP